MPELPEVEALCRFLTEQTAGESIARADLAAISALKTFNPPLAALAGRTLRSWIRRGKYLCADTDGLWLVVHLARGGWIRWSDAVPDTRVRPGKGPLALRVVLASGAGFDVTEAGTEKRLAVWLVTDPAAIDAVATLGPDPLDPSFDAAALGKVLAGQRGHIKGALTDQSNLAGVGNAYSDEALHAARLSPYRPAAKLTEEEVTRLHRVLVDILNDAVGRASGLPAKGLKAEKKSGLRVHGRTGEPCPVCSDTIREVSFATKSFQYCPTCQTEGRELADRRLSKLLK